LKLKRRLSDEELIEELKNMGVADADIPQILATEQASGHSYREY